MTNMPHKSSFNGHKNLFGIGAKEKRKEEEGEKEGEEREKEVRCDYRQYFERVLLQTIAKKGNL